MRIFTSILLLLVVSATAYSQGCSDAGFCTIDGTKPHANGDEVFKTKVKLGVNFGGADHSITIFGNYIELNQKISEKIGLDVKVTSLSQSGNGISAFGLSDAFVNFKYRTTKQLNFLAGAKLPLAGGNKSKDNLPLPMDYQSSLGTFDLILGVSNQIKKFQWVLAMQQPLTQNKNKFSAEAYPIGSPLRDFQSTNGFTRKGDVLLRMSYPIGKNKFRFTPSLLPIYHLSNDEYINALGNQVEISGSQGLTLNVNLYLDYQVGEKSAFQLNVGSPLVVRESRPDGLTRSFVMNLEYSLRF